MIEQIGVDMVRMQYQLIHGGIIRLTHCGRMIIHMVWRRPKARLSADSHWPVGSDRTAPRAISEILAITGSENPITAFIQSGTGITVKPRSISKGNSNMIANSSTSHGELRKNWVAIHDPCRTGSNRETCIRPRAAPATVPISMAKKLMIRLREKPVNAPSGPHRINPIHLKIAAMGPINPAGVAGWPVAIGVAALLDPSNEKRC